MTKEYGKSCMERKGLQPVVLKLMMDNGVRYSKIQSRISNITNVELTQKEEL